MNCKRRENYQVVMGHIAVPDEPRVQYDAVEILGNSEMARLFEERHPRIVAFERRYEGVDWRSRLL